MTRFPMVALLVGALHTIPGQAAELTVRVEGVSDAVGELMLALYDDEKQFRRQAVRLARAPARPGVVTVRFPDLPPGDYALVLFHDRNGNGELDRNRFGLPAEPWGASVGARVMFGPPGWSDARFGLTEQGAVKVVTLR